MALLELRNVGKAFATRRERHEVLRAVDLDVEAGEFVSVIGASGSGKTTLVSLMAGLMPADTGTLCFDGVPIIAPSPERGVVFQSYSLLPWMTVLENVRLAVDAVASDRSAEWRRARAEHWVRMVGLADASAKRPRELSGGMRQRVAVARGLAMEARLLLLDEPFSALDALTRANLQQELARIWLHDRRTMVMITNDVDEAILLADRIRVLTPGPGATLSASIPVPLPRPRSLRALSRDPEYRRVRRAIVAGLVSARMEAAS
jgi:nitrate/nitrite transport system ATP-binding protein